jgi:hypothetical protein
LLGKYQGTDESQSTDCLQTRSGHVWYSVDATGGD